MSGESRGTRWRQANSAPSRYVSVTEDRNARILSRQVIRVSRRRCGRGRGRLARRSQRGPHFAPGFHPSRPEGEAGWAGPPSAPRTMSWRVGPRGPWTSSCRRAGLGGAAAGRPIRPSPRPPVLPKHRGDAPVMQHRWSKKAAGVVTPSKGWCCWTGLNCRPLPYQGSALPLSYSSGWTRTYGQARAGSSHSRAAIFTFA